MTHVAEIIQTGTYHTVRAARQAACLDAGFDPFRAGGWGRCTRASLDEHGYHVLSTEERRAERLMRAALSEWHIRLFCWAADCGGREGDGEEWDYDVDAVRWDAAGRIVERHDLGRFPAISRSQARVIADQRLRAWVRSDLAGR